MIGKEDDGASQVTLVVKNCLPKQETLEIWVQSLGREDPLEEDMQPTPVFLPGEFQGQRSLAGYSPKGCTDSDMTNAT